MLFHPGPPGVERAAARALGAVLGGKRLSDDAARGRRLAGRDADVLYAAPGRQRRPARPRLLLSHPGPQRGEARQEGRTHLPRPSGRRTRRRADGEPVAGGPRVPGPIGRQGPRRRRGVGRTGLDARLGRRLQPGVSCRNADGIQRDWPRIPLPDSRKTLEGSAALGRQIAAALDSETEVHGVTTGRLESLFRTIGARRGLAAAGWTPIQPTSP